MCQSLTWELSEEAVVTFLIPSSRHRVKCAVAAGQVSLRTGGREFTSGRTIPCSAIWPQSQGRCRRKTKSFKGMRLKPPLEKNSLASQEERDSRCGWFFWLRDTGVDSGLLLPHVSGTEEDREGLLSREPPASGGALRPCRLASFSSHCPNRPAPRAGTERTGLWTCQGCRCSWL